MICRHCQVEHDPALCPSHISIVANGRDVSHQVNLRQQGAIISELKRLNSLLEKDIADKTNWKLIAEDRYASLELVQRENHELRKEMNKIKEGLAKTADLFAKVEA